MDGCLVELNGNSSLRSTITETTKYLLLLLHIWLEHRAAVVLLSSYAFVFIYDVRAYEFECMLYVYEPVNDGSLVVYAQENAKPIVNGLQRISCSPSYDVYTTIYTTHARTHRILATDDMIVECLCVRIGVRRLMLLRFVARNQIYYIVFRTTLLLCLRSHDSLLCESSCQYDAMLDVIHMKRTNDCNLRNELMHLDVVAVAANVMVCGWALWGETDRQTNEETWVDSLAIVLQYCVCRRALCLIAQALFQIVSSYLPIYLFIFRSSALEWYLWFKAPTLSRRSTIHSIRFGMNGEWRYIHGIIGFAFAWNHHVGPWLQRLIND